MNDAINMQDAAYAGNTGGGSVIASMSVPPNGTEVLVANRACACCAP